MAKRQRTTNYSDEEKINVCDLIRGHVDTIELKGYDKSTLSGKAIVWQKITEEFNSQGLSERNAQQLQNLWKDLKKKAKSCHADEKRNLFATGGGTSISNIDPVSKIVIDILPPSVLTPILGINDDDSDIHDTSITNNPEANSLPPSSISETIFKSPEHAHVDKSKRLHKPSISKPIPEVHNLQVEMLQQRINFDRVEHSKRMEIYELIKSKLSNEDTENIPSSAFSFMNYLGSDN